MLARIPDQFGGSSSSFFLNVHFRIVFILAGKNTGMDSKNFKLFYPFSIVCKNLQVNKHVFIINNAV